MPISTLSTNYSGRTKDLHIMQGVNAPNTTVITPSFGTISNYCAGIQKLIQKYTIMLLTNIGSQINFPTFGSNLISTINNTLLVNQADFYSIFNFANMGVLNTFLAYQRSNPNLPTDEQLQTAVLRDITVTGGSVSLTIQIYPIATSPFTFIIPLPQS